MDPRHLVGVGAGELAATEPDAVLEADPDVAAEDRTHRDQIHLVAPRTEEAVLLQAAETASSSRPGARKEMLEEFLERLRRLEEIARSFAGVKEAYALRAGKEVRVIVEADKVGDKEAVWLSKDIAGRIEKEIAYPGQLKVSVIRETRSVDYAM